MQMSGTKSHYSRAENSSQHFMFIQWGNYYINYYYRAN